MKYPKLKEIDYKTFSFNDFQNGIHIKGDGETGFEDCKNLVWSNGYLINRPAISSDVSNIFYIQNPLSIKKVSLASAEVYHDSQCQQIAYVVESDDYSKALYKFILIAPDGKITPCGNVEFNKNSNGEFNVAQSVSVFVGKKSKGAGVYAFFRVNMKNAADKNYRYDLQIYELDENFAFWRKVEESEMYVPHYYKDGRGSLYDNSLVKLPEPSFVEAPNLLNNSYYCTFTTDSESGYYFLPNQNFTDEDTIKIELTVHNNVLLTWVITDEPEGYSKGVEYDGEQLIVQFIRDKGVIRFVNFTPPNLKARYNNLKVTIKKKSPEKHLKVSSMFEGGRFSVGDLGNCYCLFGSQVYPTDMLIGDSADPLYFPEDRQFSVGESSQKITALKSQGKNLVIFKEREIYYISSENGKTGLYLLHSKIGCNLPKTLYLCDNRLVWANTSCKVYVLAGFNQTTGANIYCISQKISEKLEKSNITGARACAYKDKYVLFFGNEALVLDYSRATLSNSKTASKNAAWFYWRFPDGITVDDCLVYDDNIIYLINNAEQKVCYTAIMDKNSGDDRVLDYTEEEGVIEKVFAVQGMVKTDVFTDNSPFIKHFTEAWIDMLNEQSLMLDFIDDTGATIKSLNIDIKEGGSMAPHRIKPFIKAKGIGLVFNLKGKAAISAISCKYRNLN